MAERIPPREWFGWLNRFSARHCGDRAQLRVRLGDSGGHPVVDSSLVGTRYCSTHRQVEILFGDPESTSDVLTHNVWDVGTIERLLDDEGRETGLRLTFPGGATELRLPGRSTPRLPRTTRLATAAHGC